MRTMSSLSGCPRFAWILRNDNSNDSFLLFTISGSPVTESTSVQYLMSPTSSWQRIASATLLLSPV
eukprot:2275145-Pyramimonas_sp.AAC.1